MSSTQFQTDELEAVAYDFWRAPEVAEDDGWRLRFAHGVSGRANSVWPYGSGALPLDEKIDRAEAWYGARGVPVLFQVTDASRPAGLAARLVARGYEPGHGPVSVEVAMLDEVIEHTRGDAAVSDQLDDAWVELWAGTRGFGNHDVVRAILTAGDAVFARVGGEAVGRGVAVGEWLGITSMATLPQARRQGHARAIVHALARWGDGRGCKRAMIQTEAANEPARRLYAGAGFVPHHEYRYRILR